MAFREFTLVDGYTQCEVMADIDMDTGKLVGLYCYANDIPVIEDSETGRDYKVTTKPGKNPLFVHIQRKAFIFSKLLINGFLVCMPDEDDPDYNEEVAAFERARTLYNIPGDLILY